MYPYLAFLALFQAPLQPGVPLVDDCSAESRVIATLGTSDNVQVRFSIVQGPEACYAVTAILGGKPVNGYVLGSGLKAVADFEKERATPVTVKPVATLPAAPTPDNQPRHAQRDSLPVFRDFSGRDLHGKPLNLGAVNGKVILVCFWSPRDADSLREAIVVTRLSGQLRQQGVKALSVSLTSDRELMAESLEAITVPTVFNGYEVAERYGVSVDNLPRTYVLNERHELVASGLHGKELETLVRSLAAGQ